MIYLWLKALHVVGVIVFTSGLLMQSYVLRLYRDLPVPRMPDEKRLLSRCRQWDARVTVPALALAWICGLAAALYAGLFATAWLKVKLLAVVALSALHGVQSGELRRLAENVSVTGKPGGRPPAVLLGLVACAVALAVLKPF
ncbi:Uncharacterized membrane protein [Massilia sp. PDC64]|nr:CopD family protein [Massilia sp. PDC64]SDF32191.1 Uncharacterized membrane protein [Massilia sp. PDC64]